jgi:flagellar export protein FliJ
MKAFRFRLQAVLTLREQAEQDAQHRCARACAAVDQAAACLHAADAAIAAADQLRRARLAAGLRAEELEQSRLYAARLHDHRTRMARELAQARQQLEQASHQLLLATRQRETLERLRRRQHRIHDYEAGRAEQKILDEFSQRSPALASSARLEPSLAP